MNTKTKANITEVLTEIEKWCIEVSSQLKELKTPVARPKRFKEIAMSRLTTIQCPCCKGIFGIETKLLENMPEVNLHYNCPYCDKNSGLEKD